MSTMTAIETTAVISRFIDLKHRARHRVQAPSGLSTHRLIDRLTDRDADELAEAIHVVQTSPDSQLQAGPKAALLRTFSDVPFLRETWRPFDNRRKPGSLRSALADDMSRLTTFIDVDQDPAIQAELFIQKFLFHQPHFTPVWQEIQDGQPLSGNGFEALKQRPAQAGHASHSGTFMVLAAERILVSVHGGYPTEQGEVTLEYFVSRPAGLQIRLTPGVSTMSRYGNTLSLHHIRLAPALLDRQRDHAILHASVSDEARAQQHIARRFHLDEHEVTTSLDITLSTGHITIASLPSDR